VLVTSVADTAAVAAQLEVLRAQLEVLRGHGARGALGLVTVLFILALTLFANLGYRGVWRELAHSGPAVIRRRRPGWRRPAPK
jgi:hypothetical protein